MWSWVDWLVIKLVINAVAVFWFSLGFSVAIIIVTIWKVIKWQHQ